jgi:hypothetical protein
METDKTTTTQKYKLSCFSTSPFLHLKIVDTPSKGRTVVSNKDFSPGDEIFTVDAVLSVPREGWGCLACCDRTCMGYCDTYRRYFMELRSALAAANNIAKETGNPVGHIRMAIKYIALKNSKQSTFLSHIGDLRNVRDKSPEKDQDLMTAEKLISYLPQSLKDNTALLSEVAHLIGVIPSNAHKVAHIQGAALFPIASMLEHNCKPNANYETNGNKFLLTAMLPITSGQPISINYLEPYLPKAERLEQLSLRYHFECKCDACIPEARDLTRGFFCKQSKCDGIIYPAALGNEISNWICVKCSKGVTAEIFNEMMDLEKDLKSKSFSDISLGELLEGGIMHQSHFLIHRALDHRVKQLSRLRPALCENLLNRILENVEIVLSQFHPDKAVYLDIIGQVKKLMGDLQGCREAFQEALNIREKSCGKASPSTVRAKQKFMNPEKVEITLWTPS